MFFRYHRYEFNADGTLAAGDEDDIAIQGTGLVGVFNPSKGNIDVFMDIKYKAPLSLDCIPE